MIADKNYRLGYTERAEALVKQMTLEEKIRLMAGNCRYIDSMGIGSYNSFPYGAGGCARLAVPEMKFCDGPRGCVSGKSTCFPVTMARGATFDTELEERVGRAIGAEVRANGGNYYGGVCLNIPYNPGAGRSQETYGEDTVHIGRMGAALVRGIQSQNVMACIKHFAFNSMENSRFWVNVTADKRTERELYFRHFKECIDAGAASVMSSYNRYNGSFNGANSYLLRDVLKKEWDFDGFVVSDFFFGLHNTAGGLNGGLDVEMNIRRKYTARAIKRALKSGKATLAEVDEAVLRIVRTIMAFTEAKDSQSYDSSLIACKEHIALAREVAEKSITLIKNDNAVLPLDDKVIKKIAVIGDLAKADNIGDYGSSQVHPPYIKTVFDALKENYPDVQVEFVPTRLVKKSKAVKDADAVIAICGMRHGDEGEYIFVIGGDRKQLGLRKKEVAMLKAAGALNKNTVAVLIGGNMIRVNEWKDNVNAILYAYYPGMEGGSAIADVIFGKVNPSGKLPFVIGKADEDFPKVKWISLKQHYGYYHGYQKLDKDNKECDYPYGYGLSYTQFELIKPELSKVTSEIASFKATVKNVGNRKGAEILQLYIGFNNSAVDRPIKRLSDFKRLEIEAGENKEELLTVKKSDLAYYKEGTGFVEENIKYIAYIGTDEKNCENNAIEFRFE